jgi:hypothetical protein
MRPEKHGFELDCLPGCFAGPLKTASVVLLYLTMAPAKNFCSVRQSTYELDFGEARLRVLENSITFDRRICCWRAAVIGQNPTSAKCRQKRTHAVRLTLMVLRNSPSRCDTVQCGPVDDRNPRIWVNHASRQSGSCPILTALLIEVTAGTLDCSAVGLSPRPEQV